MDEAAFENQSSALKSAALPMAWADAERAFFCTNADMAHPHSKHPLDLIHRRSWADDLSEIVRDLQLNQQAIVSVNDVLDFLFSKRRDDPETAALVQRIQKSVHRAVVLNQRIQKLFAKHREEIEDVIYDEDDDRLLLLEEEYLAREKLITEH